MAALWKESDHSPDHTPWPDRCISASYKPAYFLKLIVATATIYFIIRFSAATIWRQLLSSLSACSSAATIIILLYSIDLQIHTHTHKKSIWMYTTFALIIIIALTVTFRTVLVADRCLFQHLNCRCYACIRSVCTWSTCIVATLSLSMCTSAAIIWSQLLFKAIW